MCCNAGLPLPNIAGLEGMAKMVWCSVLVDLLQYSVNKDCMLGDLFSKHACSARTT